MYYKKNYLLVCVTKICNHDIITYVWSKLEIYHFFFWLLDTYIFIGICQCLHVCMYVCVYMYVHIYFMYACMFCLFILTFLYSLFSKSIIRIKRSFDILKICISSNENYSSIHYKKGQAFPLKILVCGNLKVSFPMNSLYKESSGELECHTDVFVLRCS